MRPELEPPAFTHLRNYIQGKAILSERAVLVRKITEQTRSQERDYARKCIRTIWIIAALFTAMFAWAARQQPFGIPAPLIQVLAVTVNGVIWWLATTRLWFRWEKRK